MYKLKVITEEYIKNAELEKRLKQLKERIMYKNTIIKKIYIISKDGEIIQEIGGF